jgi:TolB-like protein
LRNQGRTVSSGLLLLLAPLLLSCASAVPPTEFTNPRFDFAFVQRVAVLPFDNLSGDRQAGFRVARLMVSELLATGAVDVVEPGEVIAALERGNVKRFTGPSAEEVMALGAALEVQGVITGSVAQSEVLRLGGAGRPVVTLDAAMLETETGSIVWSATHTEKGSAFGARVLGTGGEPISETTRRCIAVLLQSLVG